MWKYFYVTGNLLPARKDVTDDLNFTRKKDDRQENIPKVNKLSKVQKIDSIQLKNTNTTSVLRETKESDNKLVKYEKYINITMKLARKLTISPTCL